MQIYSVCQKNSEENSAYMIRAETPERAAGIFAHQMLNEDDENLLEVRTIPVPGHDPLVISLDRARAALSAEEAKTVSAEDIIENTWHVYLYEVDSHAPDVETCAIEDLPEVLQRIAIEELLAPGGALAYRAPSDQGPEGLIPWDQLSAPKRDVSVVLTLSLKEGETPSLDEDGIDSYEGETYVIDVAEVPPHFKPEDVALAVQARLDTLFPHLKGYEGNIVENPGKEALENASNLEVSDMPWYQVADEIFHRRHEEFHPDDDDPEEEYGLSM